MVDEPIVPDPALIRSAAERDAVNQRILDDLAADHPDLDGALAGPVYPEAMGAVLGKLFAAEPTPGPPWVHTLEPPEPEYDENGNPYWPLEPSFTITETGERRLGAISFVREDQLIDPNCRFTITRCGEAGDG